MDLTSIPVDWLSEHPLLWVAVITCIPWIELRGSIPVGILKLGLDPLQVLVSSVMVNIAVIYPAFIFLDWFFELMKKTPLKRFIERTQSKAQPYVERYGMLGLAFFVAVPLPGTGAYSGSLAAHIFGMKNRRAFLAISAGIAFAGLAVTLMSTVFKTTFGWILGL
ncbi:MAG: hypothetical protein GF416_00345 [Candidatus Altiarchaeales archaeon]|nr:hypothetical protein [Candidatus Altiarchaeales archaeon]MBD3415569.1 hypothetical protein [Candidatus Altiarchaeales archaeon]